MFDQLITQVSPRPDDAQRKLLSAPAFSVQPQLPNQVPARRASWAAHEAGILWRPEAENVGCSLRREVCGQTQDANYSQCGSFR